MAYNEGVVVMCEMARENWSDQCSLRVMSSGEETFWNFIKAHHFQTEKACRYIGEPLLLWDMEEVGSAIQPNIESVKKKRKKG